MYVYNLVLIGVATHLEDREAARDVYCTLGLSVRCELRGGLRGRLGGGGYLEFKSTSESIEADKQSEGDGDPWGALNSHTPSTCGPWIVIFILQGSHYKYFRNIYFRNILILSAWGPLLYVRI